MKNFKIKLLITILLCFITTNLSAEDYFIKTDEDKQLEKELMKREYVRKDIESVFCDNKTDKINTLDCISVNMYSILLENDLQVDIMDFFSGESAEKKIVKEMLIERKNAKCETYSADGARVETNKITKERYLHITVTYESCINGSKSYNDTTYLTLKILDNGLYEVRNAFQM